MDNQNKLADALLKADGIDPADISEAERAVFRQMLDSEKKRIKRLSWLSVGSVWIFAMALLGLCISENILDKLHIPFIVGFFVVVAAMWIVNIRYVFPRNKIVKDSNKKINKLHYLVHGRHRGFTMVSRRDGKRIIHWISVVVFTIGLWLILSLGGAGVYYLLCQRWIYSISPWFHIFYCTVISLSFVTLNLREGLKTPLEELTEAKPSKPTLRPNIWRTIMKSSITKFAATAAITIAVLIGINMLNGTPAYAIEQTIEAGQNVRYLHFYFYASEDSNLPDKEAWLEYDDSGQLKNIRVNWYNQPAGELVLVWKEGKTQYWEKKKQTLRFLEDEIFTKRSIGFANRYDPTRTVKNMYDLEKTGDVEIEIQESSDKTQPIILTCTWMPNTYLTERPWPQMREVVSVDPITKLVTSIEVYKLTDGEYVSCGAYEYPDYDTLFEPGIFYLEQEVPPDVKRLDQMTLDVGLE